MDIKLEQSGSKGAFYSEENGVRLAEMTFSNAGEPRIIIDHTDVSKALRGKGGGLKLVRAAVEYARGSTLKVSLVPFC